MKKIRISRGFFKQSYHLTLIQKKILYWLLVHRPKDELAYWCDLSEFYKKKRTLNNITTRKIQIHFDFNGIPAYNKLEKHGYRFYVEFEKDFIECVSGGKKITRLNLGDILKIRSLAVLNLYEILMSYKRYKEITIELDVLKQITRCNNYENYTFMILFRRCYAKLKELIDFDYKLNSHNGTKRIKSITFKFNRIKK